MTEAEWQACGDPEVMLAFLGDRASARKLRLFAVACSRRVWDQIDDLGRVAVEAAELFADGGLGADALRAARLACKGAGGRAAWYAAASDPLIAAGNAARSARSAAAHACDEALAQAGLLHDILGNPFRATAVDPAWLVRDGGHVVEIAQAIYDGRRFEDLPRLADALADAGCGLDEVLCHCRESGVHARGCWVVDALLGKS